MVILLIFLIAISVRTLLFKSELVRPEDPKHSHTTEERETIPHERSESIM
jgi:hypothetical protein